MNKLFIIERHIFYVGSHFLYDGIRLRLSNKPFDLHAENLKVIDLRRVGISQMLPLALEKRKDDVFDTFNTRECILKIVNNTGQFGP